MGWNILGDYGACGDNATWSVSGSQLTIYGTGPMWDFNEANLDAEEYSSFQVFRDSIKEIVVNGVSTLGECAFRNMDKLEQVSLPSSLTRIDYMAFYDCDVLTGMVIPAGVTEIGNYAFGYDEYTSANLYRVRFEGDMPTMHTVGSSGYGGSFYNAAEVCPFCRFH